MKLLPAIIIKPLFLATHDLAKIFLTAPPGIKMFFTIEGVFIIARWMIFHKSIEQKIVDRSDNTQIEFSDFEISQLSFYFDLIGTFMSYYGDKSEQDFVESVDYYFIKLKDIVGQRNPEKLFWCAFPDVSRSQMSGKPLPPLLKSV